MSRMISKSSMFNYTRLIVVILRNIDTRQFLYTRLPITDSPKKVMIKKGTDKIRG